MKESIQWNDIITAFVAVYGAVLSTIIIVRDQRKIKRKINLNLKQGVLAFTSGLSDPMLIFEITNPGFKNVTINAPQLRLSDGRNIIFPIPNSNVKFPYCLEEGKSAHTWIEIEEIKNNLKGSGYKGKIKIRAIVTDQTGMEFKTPKWMEMDLNQNK